LDRETGKTKYVFGRLEDKSELQINKNDLKEHFVEQNLVRYEIVMKNLESKKWFQASSDDIKKEIKTLAVNPLLSAMLKIWPPETTKLARIKIVRLTKIDSCPARVRIYGIASWFEVENPKKKKGRRVIILGVGVRSPGQSSWFLFGEKVKLHILPSRERGSSRRFCRIQPCRRISET